MTNIHQLIDDLPPAALREICERRGYRLSADISERSLRATVLADYELGLIGGREIQAAVDSPLLRAANKIIAQQNHAIAAAHARIRELEARS